MTKRVIKTKYKPGDDLRTVIRTLLDKLGGIGNFVGAGEQVLLKPNVNTADPFPASSDPAFIKAVIEVILEADPKEVIVGDSSTFYQNTRRNFNKLYLFSLAEIDKRVRVVVFDEGRWVKKQVPGGKYLHSVKMPEILDSTDKLIFLPCLKTHYIAKFTGALKLGVGLMKKSERLCLHARNTEAKIAEMNLLFRPDLIIMDGRKCFITGGPSEGEVRKPNLILASTGRLAIDLEEIKIIQSFPGNDLAGVNAEELIQIKIARNIGIE